MNYFILTYYILFLTSIWSKLLIQYRILFLNQCIKSKKIYYINISERKRIVYFRNSLKVGAITFNINLTKLWKEILKYYDNLQKLLYIRNLYFVMAIAIHYTWKSSESMHYRFLFARKNKKEPYKKWDILKIEYIYIN